jgi:hypothetical protein
MLVWMMEDMSRYAGVDDGRREQVRWVSRYAGVDDGGHEQVH